MYLKDYKVIMDNLPEKLKKLTKNKYFALVAVVFLAFLTALVFALLAYQSSGTIPNADNLQRPSGQNGDYSGSGSGSGTSGSQSPLDKLVSIVTGRKSENTSKNQDGTTQNDDKDVPSTSLPRTSEREILTEKIKKEALPIPKVDVKKYVLKTQLPPKPEKATIYSMRTNFSDNEIDAFSQKLGFSSMTSDEVITEKSNKLTQIYDLKNRHFLSFNKENGNFVFISEKGYKTNAENRDSVDIASNFLTEVGRNDECITQTAKYSTKSDPGITFVEFHCDWNTFGAPILGTLGVMNVPQSKALVNITITDQSESNIVDNEIEFSSDNVQTMRKNDFNTITIGVQESTGNVMTASSNIPVVRSTETVGTNKILSPQDSLTLLEENKSLFSVVSPEGEGYVDFKKIFSDNMAMANSVDVTDFVLAYNVVPGQTKDVWCPEYLTRSSGDLSTGPSATFVQTIPAVNDPRCMNPKVLGVSSLAQAQPTVEPTMMKESTKSTSGIDYTTFKFEATQEDPPVKCPPNLSFTNSYKIADGVYMLWFYQENKRLGRKWYIAWTNEATYAAQTGSGNSLSSINPGIRAEYLTMRSNIAFKKCPKTQPSQCTIQEGFANQIIACEYLTTGSPSLYGYSPDDKDVTVSVDPYGGVGYLNPPFSEPNSNTWNILIKDGMHIFSNGISKDRLYYEFRKNALLQKVKEYESLTNKKTVRKDFLEKEFISIAKSINLNEKETEDLLAEVVREARDIHSTYIQITLLPKSFVDAYLDLSIKPQPEHIYRYIFFIQPADSKSIDTLRLNRIVRNGYYFIEAGVLADN